MPDDPNKQFRLDVIDALATLGVALAAHRQAFARSDTWGELNRAQAEVEYEKAIGEFVALLEKLNEAERDG